MTILIAGTVEIDADRRDKALAEMVRVLRPGGHVVIASSLGQDTPFSTSESLISRKFRRHGIRTVRIGEAGSGTYFVGRKDSAS